MKLGFKEKFAYGIGAVGKDMVYMLSASYILYYYQDIMGVSAWVMGIILLIARIFDAFNDPLMGVLVAKTKTKWGKFRPWLFIGTLTNAVVLFFMFAAPPSLTGKGLIAYAAAAYILWGITYTMMDIPYWSMVPAFTQSGKEREGMSALGRSCAGVGSAIITIITIIAVPVIGNFALGKSNDNVIKSYINAFYESERIEAYVAELDEAGNSTGNIIKMNSLIIIDVNASAKEHETETAFNNSNCNYTVNILDKDGNILSKYNQDNSSLDLVADGKNMLAVAVLYLSSEEFSLVNGDLDFETSINSTKEVDRLGFKYFALIIAVLFFLFITITCVFIKEKSTVDVETTGISDMIKALVQNDQAMALVITIVLVNSSVYITSNLLIYFFKYDLGGASWEGNYTLFNTFGGGIQILAMMLFFPVLRKFFDTIKIFYISVISAIFGYIVLFVMALSGVSVVYPFLVPAFFIFGAVGMLNVLLTIFLANTVDYGEVKNNRRDESVIFSMQTFVVKLASGIAALAAALSLSAFNISQTDRTFEAVDGSLILGIKTYLDNLGANGVTEVSGGSVMGLRFVMSVLPMFVLAIALLIFRKKYTLNDEKLKDITEQIAQRRANAVKAE